MATSSRFFPVLIGFGGLAFGALFLFLGYKLWNSSVALARDGITLQAKVVKKLRKADVASWGGLEDYFVHLNYTTSAGEKLDTELKLNSKVWRKLDEGGRFDVSYLPANPKQIFAGPVWGHRVRCGIAAGLMLFGAAAVFVFPIGGIREFLRMR